MLKLVQQEAAHAEQAPLFGIPLDLKKAFDTMDRDGTPLILQDYGVGPNTLNVIKELFWDNQIMVPQHSVASMAGLSRPLEEALKAVLPCLQSSILLWMLLSDAGSTSSLAPPWPEMTLAPGLRTRWQSSMLMMGHWSLGIPSGYRPHWMYW